jgi:hypothetical protein
LTAEAASFPNFTFLYSSNVPLVDQKAVVEHPVRRRARRHHGAVTVATNMSERDVLQALDHAVWTVEESTQPATSMQGFDFIIFNCRIRRLFSSIVRGAL